MQLDLENRRVLVTGASVGIGFSCAECFAREGSHLVLVARTESDLLDAAETIRSRSDGRGDVTTHVADLAIAQEREGLASRFPDLDVLVNNAGAIPGGGLADLSMEEWEDAWRLKVFGYIHLTQLYLARMGRRGSGVIFNIIGNAGRAPRADYVCGASGNASLIAFTEAVGGRSIDVGVRVLGVNPGPTNTPRFRAFGKKKRFDLPLDRPAEPEEIADLVVYLASARAGYMSGTVVDIDGGLLNRG